MEILGKQFWKNWRITRPAIRVATRQLPSPKILCIEDVLHPMLVICDSAFSSMKRLKSDARNRMADETWMPACVCQLRKLTLKALGLKMPYGKINFHWITSMRADFCYLCNVHRQCLKAQCGHFLSFFNFSISYFHCYCYLLRHTPWLFRSYNKVFVAIGIFFIRAFGNGIFHTST